MHVFLWLLLRLGLGTMWIVAGLAKIADLDASREAASQIVPLPERASWALGTVLPLVELTLGALLVAGYLLEYAAYVSAALLTAFTLAILAVLLRGRHVECNCFGQLGRGEITWLSLGRNLILLGIAAALGWRHPGYFSIDRQLTGSVGIPGEPNIVEFIPVLALVSVCVVGGLMLTSVWQTAAVVAHAEDGPAVGTPEWSWLRKWPQFQTHDRDS